MNLSIVKSLFAFLVVFGLTKSFIIERRTDRFDYLENLAEDLEIFEDVNVRFVFDQDFFRRNTNAADKTKLTTVLDASSIANCFRVQLAVVNFHDYEKVTALNVQEENGARLAWNAQGLPVKNTSGTALYDISWILDEWRALRKSPGKLSIGFDVASNSSSKKSRKRILKKWSAMVKDKTWLKTGPVFLVAYFKDSGSKLSTRPNPTVNETRAHKLRSGVPLSCKLHSFQTSFQELGLNNVYIKPRGLFNLFACYGPCDPTGSVDSRVQFMTTHAWILELARAQRVRSKPTDQLNHLQTCCVATSYVGQRVLKKELDSETVVWEYIPDFTASECGCR